MLLLLCWRPYLSTLALRLFTVNYPSGFILLCANTLAFEVFYVNYSRGDVLMLIHRSMSSAKRPCVKRHLMFSEEKFHVKRKRESKKDSRPRAFSGFLQVLARRPSQAPGPPGKQVRDDKIKGKRVTHRLFNETLKKPPCLLLHLLHRGAIG